MPIKKNIVANYAGNFWVAIMSLIFVPLYIHFMGIESYGLIGIFVTLLGFFSLLDMGLSITLNREMARLSVLENKMQEMRDLLRTLEIPYWGMATLVGVTVVMLSPVVAYHWVHAKTLSSVSVQRAIIIMGIATVFQWPLGLYSGGLMGLQRQILLNSINATMATFRGAGAVLVLWLISPTVEAFFVWQAVTSFIHTGLMVFSLWRSLPNAAETPCFRRQLLSNIWRFAAGITGTTVLSAILMQMDKVILSRMLTLEMFGYYTLAGAVAMNLYRLIYPVITAVSPSLANLVALGSSDELAKLYHKSAQLVSVIILPVTFVIALYSKEILLLWTRNPALAEHTYLLVSILIIGTALNGLMNMPYCLQVAAGWTRLAFFVNLVSVLLLVPLMIILVKWYGAVGAASVWMILNSGYILFAVQIMHRRLLPTEKLRWYCIDIGLPLGVALLTTGVFRLTMPIPIRAFAQCANILMVFSITLGITALVTPVTRTWIKRNISTLRFFYAVKF